MSTLDLIAREGAPLTYTMSCLTSLRSEIWAMEEQRCRGFAHILGSFNQRDRQSITGDARTALVAQKKRAVDELIVENGVARIPIAGVILRSVPWFVEAMEFAAMGVDATQAAINAALERDDVKEIRFDVDSPGGSISGLAELAAVIYNAREEKPVITHVNGMMASAALWLGTQASHVSASPGSLIGSIGAFMTITDSSDMADQWGIRVHLIRTGPYKGTGTPGVKVSKDELDHNQHIIDEIGSQFGDAVALGRGLPKSRVKKIANGKLFTAEEAQRLKLIDTIELSETTTKTETAPEVDEGANEGEGMNPKKDAPEAGVDPGIVDRLASIEQNQTKLTKENLALQEDSKRQKARADALQAQLVAKNAKGKDDLIQAAVEAGRIDPLALASVEKYAATVDAEELETFLATAFAKPVTRSTAKSKTTDQGVDERPAVTADDLNTARILGMDIDELLDTAKAHEQGPEVFDFKKLKVAKDGKGVTFIGSKAEVN